MAAVEGQATQLDFHQAMEDFKTMFPYVDADVIEAVLRANHGAVHETIDQLLTMTTDGTSQTLVSEGSIGSHLPQHLDPSGGGGGEGGGGASNELPPSYALSATPPPSYQQAVPNPHPSPSRALENVNAEDADGETSLCSQRNWTPPLLLPLPQDFLRLTPAPHQVVGVLSPRCLSQRLNENALAREAVGESDAELSQYLKDERIALFLQNDEFMNELRTNREFIDSLQEDYKEGQSEFEDEDYEGEGDRGPFTEHLDDATLRERISTMGKASRKKFAQIAKVFSRRKRTSGRSLLPGASGGDLLIQDEKDEEEERPPPVTEDEDVATANNIR